MRRPDFIFGGATRSGLSALMQILDEHPQIFIPSRKENQFFRQSQITDTTPESFRIDFEDAVHTEYKIRIPEDRILHGEPEYDPVRAHAGCPHAKVIFTLRDPTKRAYIQFQHALQEKKETVKNFEHAVEAELAGLRTPETTGRCWIYKNQYQTHIEHWLSFYPREKVFIMIYEEWTDPNFNGFKGLEDFLGLRAGSILEGHDKAAFLHSVKESTNKKFPPLSESTQEQLEDILAVDKTYISNLLGRQIKHWNYM